VPPRRRRTRRRPDPRREQDRQRGGLCPEREAVSG
jgi:hypothetical protein